MNNYEKLVAWQKAHQLVIKVYEITREFPREEQFGLTIQLRRAASSIATNIVEGKSRRHLKEYLQFLNVARGSTGETHYHLRLARDLHYIDDSTYQELSRLTEDVGRLINGLIKSLEKRQKDS